MGLVQARRVRVVARAAPYDPNSAREMLRANVLGDEPIE